MKQREKAPVAMNQAVDDLQVVKSSQLFDASWYLKEYKDVAILGLAPELHFLRFGARLLRDPGPAFNTRSYLLAHPDVAASGVNPLVHYLRDGRTLGGPSSSPAQGPTPTELFDASSSLANQVSANAVSPSSPAAAIPVPRRLRGFLDKLDATTLGGWAIDELNPGKPVKLSIYLDDVRLMDIQTSQPRRDLAAKGMNGQVAGYSVAFPPGLFQTKASIDIRFSDTDISLSKSPRQVESTPTSPSSSHTTYLDTYRLNGIRPVTVIVAIFNAHDAVSDCLQSLTANLPRGADVLMMDDCSSDARIDTLLTSYSERHGFRLHRNETNIGYTRSVNKGIALSPERDVVLLNSDTVVTPRWLDNLRYCAYATPRVATVTALSDNAGAFSVPEIGVANEVPPHLTSARLARAIVQAGIGHLHEVPTGNGFCLYIRRDALDTIGPFDETKFPRGYGEENDFCMRALRIGWKNVVCDKSFVFHKRSQSFQGEKIKLMEAGSRQVNQDFPEYRLLIQRYRDAEFSLIRYRVRQKISQATNESTLPRILYVISTQTGGTPQTNMDLMRAMRGRYQCFLARCDASTITLSLLVGDELELVETHHLKRPIDPVSHRSDEYDQVLLQSLYAYSIDLLHVRHIAWHSLGLADCAKALGVPVVYSLHDFYSLCPSLNLLDEKMQHCGGVCTAGAGTCKPSLWPTESLPLLKHQFVRRWHEMFADFLASCDQLITTAPSAASIINNVYPESASKLTVIPHGRDFEKHHSTAKPPTGDERIRILVPGNISVTKGALLIREMADLDIEKRFEFHILGNISRELMEVGVQHGKYDRSNFSDHVVKIAPHLGVVLSIWPETYCHTLTEMWSCGVPVLAINLGAVGDRISESGAGWLVDAGISAQSLLEQLARAVDDAAGYNQRLEAVRRWQRTEGTWNLTHAMAAEYRAVYRRLLASDRRVKAMRVGLLVKGRKSHPATAHIRLLSPLGANSTQDRYDARPVSATWLLSGGAAHIDLVVVQRDAVPLQLVDRLCQTLKENSVPLIFEVDDLLWKLPADHTEHTITQSDVSAMTALAAHADTVTVSTPALAVQLPGTVKNARVVPNALDPSLWTKPISPTMRKAAEELLQLDEGTPALLYMGTRSHALDLELIVPAIAGAIEAEPALKVYQIGGGTLLPNATLLTAPDEYRAFVPWFRAVAERMTLAVAPLRDDEFNRCKSDIKTLDYGLSQVPAIFSNVGPYVEAVTHGETGILVDNRIDAWRDSILMLLRDGGLRNRIRDLAFNRALHRTTETTRTTWRDVLDKTVARHLGRANITPPSADGKGQPRSHVSA